MANDLMIKENINNLFNSNLELMEFTKKITQQKNKIIIFLTLAIFLTLYSPIPTILIWFKSFEKVYINILISGLFLALTVFGVVLFIMSFLKYKAFKKVNIKTKLINILLKDNFLNNVYKSSFYKNIKNWNINEFHLNILNETTIFNKTKTSIEKNYLVPQIEKIKNLNCISFIYKDHKVKFYIDNPIKFLKEQDKNKEDYFNKDIYISSAIILIDNILFNKEYDDVILYNKSWKKNFYKTNYNDFDKKYCINLKQDDARAKNFLKEEYIKAWATLSYDKLYSIGVKKNIYANIFQVSQVQYFNQIGLIDFENFITIKNLKNKLIKKVQLDLNMLSNLFSYLKIFY
ncbi:hypothetical protein [Spiroplasma tabanidicola]|uniref:DUF3137 domain-containing protein n=1 Tax=Spiroplasma tabanidicola TaxID=324079 RepID=A0A6I6CBP8_9MOLU|nr:hypothetical protein [Spiroplasma tabanidicola]QGS51512.1 hypothetical protein STABA_v1c01450 [Spiroplasma tabanidicola]